MPRRKDKPKPKTKIHVSDHAVLRYLERVKGFDIDSIKDEMVTHELRVLVAGFGGEGEFPGPGCRFLLKDKTIITVKT